jgi:RNA polymerase sigma factor (TIGR02999 family)
MSTNGPPAITELLKRITAGDRNAANELFEGLYTQLRSMAGAAMKEIGPGHTLQPTALVHEGFAKLIQGQTLSNLKDRWSFYSLAAKTMRSILVDHARKKKALKRPPEDFRTVLDDLVDEFERTEQIELLALDEALKELEREDDRPYQIVSLHFFGGMRFNEIADHLGVSLSTVEKDWKYARCWLLDRLNGC